METNKDQVAELQAALGMFQFASSAKPHVICANVMILSGNYPYQRSEVRVEGPRLNKKGVTPVSLPQDFGPIRFYFAYHER